MIGAIILAAGESRRMGQPKASLPFRGGTFLSTVIEAARTVRLRPVVVVLGVDGRKLLLERALDGCTVVWNFAADGGPAASLKAGLAVLNHTVEAFVAWHVDRPHVRPETVTSLVGAFQASRLPIVVPIHAGRRGHPVLFGREVFAELESVPLEQGVRLVVRKDPARVLEVPTDDGAVLEDINTPSQYRDMLDRE